MQRVVVVVWVASFVPDTKWFISTCFFCKWNTVSVIANPVRWIAITAHKINSIGSINAKKERNKWTDLSSSTIWSKYSKWWFKLPFQRLFYIVVWLRGSGPEPVVRRSRMAQQHERFQNKLWLSWRFSICLSSLSLTWLSRCAWKKMFTLFGCVFGDFYEWL